MNIYFASLLEDLSYVPEVLTLPYKYGFLSSYAKLKNKFPNTHNRNFILDSGAFSISTGKADHSLTEYAQFLLANREKLSMYANLDVIGNAEKTQVNQTILESMGLSPLPTFHYGSDYKILEQLIKKYDYIGLGGLVGMAKRGGKQNLMKHLDQCFSMIRLNCRVHGWGMMVPDILTRYPFYSVDSTGWLAGRMFKVKFISNGLELKRESRSDLNYAFDSNQLNLKNIIAYCRLSEQVTDLWASRGIKWD